VHTDDRDESYLFNDYSIIRPDGNIDKHFVTIKYPYDKGPGTVFNITGTWRPAEFFTGFFRVGCFSSSRLIHPRSSSFTSVSGATIVDASATFKDFLFDGFELVVSARNLFDKDYNIPGTYTTISGDPLEVTFVARKKW